MADLSMVDRERWTQLSLYEQMANIGSEVGRSIIAHKKGMQERMNGAINRAIDLFEATIDDLAKQKSHCLKEVLLAKEEYLKLFFSDEDNAFDDADKIEAYFMNYAFLVRADR